MGICEVAANTGGGMSVLRIFQAESAQVLSNTTDFDEIATLLHGIGLRFERWQTNQPLAEGATGESVIAAYQESVNKLMGEYGFEAADVVALGPDHADKVALRQKFLPEHNHTDFEVRFFVEGKGLFYIHQNEKVYAVMCEKGDLISVPANTPHWFDMGENPDFKCIRLFTSAEGWVANYTGLDISSRFPTFENF